MDAVCTTASWWAISLLSTSVEITRPYGASTLVTLAACLVMQTARNNSITYQKNMQCMDSGSSICFHIESACRDDRDSAHLHHWSSCLCTVIRPSAYTVCVFVVHISLLYLRLLPWWVQSYWQIKTLSLNPGKTMKTLLLFDGTLLVTANSRFPMF